MITNHWVPFPLTPSFAKASTYAKALRRTGRRAGRPSGRGRIVASRKVIRRFRRSEVPRFLGRENHRQTHRNTMVPLVVSRQKVVALDCQSAA